MGARRGRSRRNRSTGGNMRRSHGRAAGSAFILVIAMGAGCTGLLGIDKDYRESKPCLLDADCDDANPCSDDLCAMGACEHPPSGGVPNDDHNECTIDSCEGGMPRYDGAGALGKKC